MHFHHKNIRMKFGCKKTRMREVIAFYSTTYWTQIS